MTELAPNDPEIPYLISLFTDIEKTHKTILKDVQFEVDYSREVIWLPFLDDLMLPFYKDDIYKGFHRGFVYPNKYEIEKLPVVCVAGTTIKVQLGCKQMIKISKKNNPFKKFIKDQECVDLDLLM